MVLLLQLLINDQSYIGAVKKALKSITREVTKMWLKKNANVCSHAHGSLGSARASRAGRAGRAGSASSASSAGYINQPPIRSKPQTCKHLPRWRTEPWVCWTSRSDLSSTNVWPTIAINLVAFKAGAELDLWFNKPAFKLPQLVLVLVLYIFL
jgi:hypothetical protein